MNNKNQSPFELKFNNFFTISEELISFIERKVFEKCDFEATEKSFYKGILSWFLAKGVTAFEAIILLCKHGHGDSAAILSRQFIEMIADVAFMQDDPENKAEICAYFFDFEKLNYIQKIKGTSTPWVSREWLNFKEQELVNSVNRLKSKYKFKEKQKTWSQHLPDGDSVRSKLKHAKLDEIYQSYVYLSNLVHINQLNMSKDVSQNGCNLFINYGKSEINIKPAIVTAFEGLLYLLEVMDKYLKLGIGFKIEEFRSKMMSLIKNNPNLLM